MLTIKTQTCNAHIITAQMYNAHTVFTQQAFDKHRHTHWSWNFRASYGTWSFIIYSQELTTGS